MRTEPPAASLLRAWTCRAMIAALVLASPGGPQAFAAGVRAAALEVRPVALPAALAIPGLDVAAPSSIPSLPSAAPQAALAAPAQAALPAAAPVSAAAPTLAASAAPLPALAAAATRAEGAAPAGETRASIDVLRAAAADAAAGRDTGALRFDGKFAAPGAPAAPPSGGSNAGGQAPSGAPQGLPTQAPVIALNGVFFPGTAVRLTVTGAEGRNAVLAAMGNGGWMIAASRPERGGDAKGNSPAAVLVKLSGMAGDGEKVTARMEAVRSVNITGYVQGAKGVDLAKVDYPQAGPANPARMGRLGYLATSLLGEFADSDPEISDELAIGIQDEKDGHKIAAVLSQGLPFSDDIKRKLLATPSGEARLEALIFEMMAHLKAKRAEASQPGDPADDGDALASPEAFQARLAAIGMPENVRAVALKEYEAYAQLNPKDGEAAKLRTYLQWLLDVPWAARTVDNFDGARARQILDKEHYGLEKVKERVLEFLAVRKKTGSKKGAILLFVGPPGVGKTSIAGSIAASLGRRFVRLSLGGVHDETVLRGHGRTYQGSLPGQIIRQMKAAGTVNPLMLLDEVDKIGRDGNHGDPTAALLEILDPQQNNTFRDQYLDVPYDLSQVLFVVTANDRSAIPGPLQDRLEIIEFDGYTPLEKLGIAERHIIPEKLAANGLTAEEARLTKSAIRKIIEGYTMESGVRNLRETIDSVFRKVAAWIETRGEKAPGAIDAKDVEHYLGAETFRHKDITQNDVGVATGLAVNGYGGSTMNVVVRAIPGSGRVRGRAQQLEMIKDSAENAFTFVRTNAAKFGLENVDFSKIDLDIAFTPAGKIDGPSAGGLMTTAIISELSGRKVAPSLAMTGEITPDGRILPIGGLKQKVMAAHRMGYKTVIFPAANEKDVESIPEEVRKEITLKAVRTYDEILPLAFGEQVPGRGAAFLKLPAAEGAPAAAATTAAVPAAAARPWAVRGPITVTMEADGKPRDPVVTLSGPQGTIDRFRLHEAREALRQATRTWWNPSTWFSRTADPATMNVEAQQDAVEAYAGLLAARARRR